MLSFSLALAKGYVEAAELPLVKAVSEEHRSKEKVALFRGTKNSFSQMQTE